MRISFRRVDGVEPKFEGPPFGRGSCICGFIANAPDVEVQYARGSCHGKVREQRSLGVELHQTGAIIVPRAANEYVTATVCTGP